MSASPLAGLDEPIAQLRETGRYLFDRGWSLGTSSNYSLVIDRDPLRLLVTASGKDKGRLGAEDFVLVGEDGQPTVAAQPKSSAETLLHVVAAQSGANAVLHTHSIWSTLLSDWYFEQGGLEVSGYEMLKGLAGVTTHEHTEWLPIFENTQDIPALAEQVREYAEQAARRVDQDGRPAPAWHGYLIRRHGMYTWGQDLAEARRHVEILEFLLEVVARQRTMSTAGAAAWNH